MATVEGGECRPVVEPLPEGLLRIAARRRRAQVFRARRRALAVTQAVLAEAAGCLPSQVGLVERGRAGVGAAVLARIEAALARLERGRS